MAQYFLQCVSQFYCFAADESLQKEDLSMGRQPTHTLTLFARRLANCCTHILSQDFPKCERSQADLIRWLSQDLPNCEHIIKEIKFDDCQKNWPSLFHNFNPQIFGHFYFDFQIFGVKRLGFKFKINVNNTNLAFGIWHQHFTLVCIDAKTFHFQAGLEQTAPLYNCCSIFLVQIILLNTIHIICSSLETIKSRKIKCMDNHCWSKSDQLNYEIFPCARWARIRLPSLLTYLTN